MSASNLSRPQKESTGQNRNYIMYVLIGLVVVASFVIGSLFTKVKKLETDKGGEETASNSRKKAGSTDPKRVELTISDEDPSLGSKDAKVVVVEFSDFLCPFCAAFSGQHAKMIATMKQRFGSSWQPALPGIKEEYVKSGKVRFVWKDAPFHGKEAILVHQAARCASDQGKFWDYHDLVYKKQGEMTGKIDHSQNYLISLASELGLKIDIFKQCLQSGKYAQTMKDAVTYAQSVGVKGTPTTFINGEPISGAATYTAFKSLIEKELDK